MNPLLSLEQTVLGEGREWTRQRLEAQAQKEIDRWANRCPQNGELLTYRKRQRLKLTTCRGDCPQDLAGLFRGDGPLGQSRPTPLGIGASATLESGTAIASGLYGDGDRFV